MKTSAEMSVMKGLRRGTCPSAISTGRGTIADREGNRRTVFLSVSQQRKQGGPPKPAATTSETAWECLYSLSFTVLVTALGCPLQSHLLIRYFKKKKKKKAALSYLCLCAVRWTVMSARRKQSIFTSSVFLYCFGLVCICIKGARKMLVACFKRVSEPDLSLALSMKSHVSGLSAEVSLLCRGYISAKLSVCL